MARLTYEQINAIKKKAFENLSVLLERYPTEEEKENVEKQLEEIMPRGMRNLLEKSEKEALEAYNNLQKVVSEIQDDLNMGCNIAYTFYKPGFRYNTDYVKQFDKFLESERNRISKKEGYLKILDRNSVLDLLYENITFTPTRGKDMCDILDEVVKNTFANIKANPDKYFEK